MLGLDGFVSEAARLQSTSEREDGTEEGFSLVSTSSTGYQCSLYILSVGQDQSGLK